MLEPVWLDDGDTIINEWFVQYWVAYREIIEKLYPTVHAKINTLVLDKMNKNVIENEEKTIRP